MSNSIRFGNSQYSAMYGQRAGYNRPESYPPQEIYIYAPRPRKQSFVERYAPLALGGALLGAAWSGLFEVLPNANAFPKFLDKVKHIGKQAAIVAGFSLLLNLAIDGCRGLFSKNK